MIENEYTLANIMLNFPHFKQQDSTDCGATCLRIISAHYGKFFSPYKLKEATNITNEGVSLLSISEAAEKIGYRSMGANVSFDTLKQAPLPCVIHWNQNHFVVVYDYITLNVPFVAVSNVPLQTWLF